jgi:hypothetical protein
VPASQTLGPLQCTTRYPRRHTSGKVPLNHKQHPSSPRRKGAGGEKGHKAKRTKEQQPNKEGNGNEETKKQNHGSTKPNSDNETAQETRQGQTKERNTRTNKKGDGNPATEAV